MKALDFYSYSRGLESSLADNAAVDLDEIVFDNETDFEVQEIRTSGINKIYVSMKTASGNSSENEPFNSTLVGSGQNKLLFQPGQVVIPASTKLQIKLLNKTGAAVTSWDITFFGRKILKQ